MKEGILKVYRRLRIRLVALVALVLVLPLGLALVVRQTRLISEGATTATLAISPASQQRNVGVAGTAEIFLNPNGENVAGVQVAVTYDANIISVTNIVPGPFFTDHAGTVGQPVEIVKNISTPGQIIYALGFPLGSNFGSTSAKAAAVISFNTVSAGTATFSFAAGAGNVVSNVAGENVLSSTTNGTVTVGSLGEGAGGGPRLYFSSPRPGNPQVLNTNFEIDVLMDTAGQNVDGVDASITFAPGVLSALTADPGTGTPFTSYPSRRIDNLTGSIQVSANIGSGSTAAPVNGAAVNVAKLIFRPLTTSSGSQLAYVFTPGSRNDSNIVLAGTSQTGDPIDVLASVDNATIVIGTAVPTSTPVPASPTPTRTPTPTPVPPTATPTRTPTPTQPLPTVTPTAPSSSSVSLRLALQGRTRTGVSRSRDVVVEYRTVVNGSAGTVVANTVTTNSAGEAVINLLPGAYVFRVKPSGYLAHTFGSVTAPISIQTGQTLVDLSGYVLLGGDLDANGVVNEIDYSTRFLPQFLGTSSFVDLDGSGQVNTLDFSIIRGNWGRIDDSI